MPTDNELKRKLKKRIEKALVLSKGIILTARELRLINVKRMEREYDHFTEEDSPKGEYIPGVRFRNYLTHCQDCTRIKI